MPIYHHLNVFIEIGLPLFVILIENIFARIHQYVTLFFARKLIIILIVSSITIVCSFIFIVSWINKSPEINIHLIISTLQFFMQGGIVGVVIRQLLLSISQNNLFGRSFRIQRLLFLLGVSVFVWLFPISQRYGDFAGFYMLGLTSGLIAHFLWRRILLKNIRLSRYGRSILEMIKGHSSDLSDNEKKAFLLFINQKWKKLDLFYDKIEENKESSPRLKILKACSHRVRGNYIEAIHYIDNELNNSQRNTDFDHLLYLQKALAHSELKEDTQMIEALQKAENMYPDNFSLKATLALRLAEEIPLETPYIDEAQRPLELIREAIFLSSRDSNTELMANLLGRTLPFRWGFIHDVYGYTLLKSGNYLFSKDLFLSCIEKEPSFSSSYLHLGEWYISYNLNRKKSKKNLRLAKLCLLIAWKLEKNKNSRISKRAKELISEYIGEINDLDDTE